MQNPVKVTIYGDSIMRGTVMDEKGHYRATMPKLLAKIEEKFAVVVQNRARFGITVQKGKKILEKDLAAGLSCQYALVEFGGNDCSFAWHEVAAAPQQTHLPFTQLKDFKTTYINMVGQLQQAGVTPILMTLPPVDAERHLQHVSGGNAQNQKNILAWLGDTQMIYRFHELYSNTVAQIAQQTGALVLDVRDYFLDKHNLKSLIGKDGVHPTSQGYALVLAAAMDFIRSKPLASQF
ncbi:SGNH/GDSL hydrolase family protein [Ruminococcaceae bacterium OttesenSCG-928-A16]|nr:SGNH/GDSL hydrolase family protein [Ruminococcaceae bacterium OttesenSCG-928-A16]